MKNKIYPCLWFDGQASEAAQFYCSLFDNATITSTSSLVVTFEIDGQKFMGLNGGPAFNINPSISFFVKCGTIDETNNLWEKLVEGGSILMTIDTYPWSQRYGWLKDKFGVTWQIMLHDEGPIDHQIKAALLFTQQQFGRAQEAINFYTGIFRHSKVQNIIQYPEGDPNAGNIMFAECSIEHFPLIVMDGPGQHGFTFNEGVSFVVNCSNQEEVDYYWNQLFAGGGSESQCGWLKDKFGISWQVVPTIVEKLMNDPDKKKGEKMMQALLKMKKLDVAMLEKAANEP